MHFTVIDWVIVVVLVGGLIWSGFWGKSLIKSVAQFTVAGRHLGMWLGLSTGQAEAMGLICIANGVQMGFMTGFSYIWVQLLANLVTIVCFGILGLGIMRYRATNVHTLPQYLEMRYSRNLRIFAGITLAIGGVLNMAIFPTVESQFLVGFLGLPERVQFLGMDLRSFSIVLFFVLLLSLFFTAIGGMVSVVITEYVQTVVMFVTLTLITVFIVLKAGLGPMKDVMENHLGAKGFSPLEDQSLGWAFLLAYVIGTFLQYLAFPPSLQKYSAAKTPKIVRNTTLLTTIFGLGRVVQFNIWGIAALVIVGTAIPVGVSAEDYQRTLGGIMLKKVTPSGLIGVALASFIFASVSTVNVYLLSWSSVIANDVIATIRRQPLGPRAHIWLLRLVTAGVAVFILLFGVLYKPSETINQYFIITGDIFGAVGIIAWFGLYWRRASTAGAWSALILGVSIPLGWLVFKQLPLYQEIVAAHPDLMTKVINQNNMGLFATLFPATTLLVIGLLSNAPTKYVDYGDKLREIKAQERAAEEAEARARLAAGKDRDRVGTL